MKLVAILLVRNELGRYLEPCIRSLQEYVDEIRVTDDASDDGTFEWLAEQDRVEVAQLPSPRFWQHEGRARQAACDWAFQSKGTHYLSVDADELIINGLALREQIEADPNQPAWSLEMVELWAADAARLYARVDGGWRIHPLTVAWRGPEASQKFRMLDRKLACRRVPMSVLSARAKASSQTIFHLGWLDKTTRQARYNRYAKHDGGKYHASAHLRSILFPDSRVRLQPRAWPDGPVFDQLRERFAAMTA